MRRQLLAVLFATAALTACGEPATSIADREEEGVYGSSSGPNPNTADLRPDEQERAQQRPPADPATTGENAYPSQMGDPGEPSTGAEGGRSSAQTGATNE